VQGLTNIPFRSSCRAALRLARWVALATLLFASSARASDRLTELSNKLKTDKDFRVRTQAALALGVSQSDRAVAPLCGGLDDENHTVRAASAAALGKLRRGGAECLTKHLSSERHPKVKEMLAKALKRLAQPQLPRLAPRVAPRRTTPTSAAAIGVPVSPKSSALTSIAPASAKLARMRSKRG
jgi:HEAT repeat protein